MTIQEVHDRIDFLLKKTRTGFFSREKKDAAIHNGQLAVFASYFAEFLQTQYVHEALRPFRETIDLTTNNTGYVAYPSGYEHATGAMVNYYDNELQQNFVHALKFYKSDELPDALSSQVRPVANRTPISVLTKTGVQVYPKTAVYTVTLNYLSTPVKPLYSYTASGTVETYVSGTSVHPQWADTYINAVIMKAIEALGVNLKSPEMVQYANEKTIQNQTSPIKT